MYSVDTTSQFEHSIKICKMRGKRIDDLWDVVAILMEEGCLPASFFPHQLTGVMPVYGNVILKMIGC